MVKPKTMQVVQLYVFADYHRTKITFSWIPNR